MSGALAWMFALPDGGRAAVGETELVHLLPVLPQLFTVPGTPAACARVFIWNDAPVPVFDPASWQRQDPSPAGEMLAVVAYRDSRDGQTRFAGLLIPRVPERVPVSDESAVGPEKVASRWRDLSHAAFEYQQHVVPVFDLQRIFRA